MTDSATTAESYALPWGTTPEGELTRTGTIFGAIVGTLGVFLFLPLAILDIVLNCRASTGSGPTPNGRAA